MNPWVDWKVKADWWSQAYACGCHYPVSHLSAFARVISSHGSVFKEFPS